MCTLYTQENACLATCHDACFLLLSLLDPREKCTPLQVLTTKVMVKAVHVLHNTPAEVQVNVDEAVLLVGFLHLLSPRYHEDGLISPCIRMIIALLGMNISLSLSLSLSLSPPQLLMNLLCTNFQTLFLT